MYDVGTKVLDQISRALFFQPHKNAGAPRTSEEFIDVSDMIMRGRSSWIERAVFRTSRTIFTGEDFDEPYMSGRLPAAGLDRAELNVVL